MRVLIIEDEKIAAQRLEQLIHKIFPDADVLGHLETIRQSVKWFEANDAPDLVFLDIQLADGISFDIFKKVKVTAPIIFTTSYDKYALKAFELNSVDYLLKPLKEDDLEKAINKYVSVKNSYQKNENLIDQAVMSKLSRVLNRYQYKDRFLVKVGEHIRTFNSDEILYFVSSDKTTYVHLEDGKKYIIDYTLDQLSDLVNPDRFFRINRKYLISIDSCQDIVAWSNSRLRVCIKNNSGMDAVVAREKVNDFKKWLEGDF